jgi:hypothetical protein
MLESYDVPVGGGVSRVVKGALWGLRSGMALLLVSLLAVSPCAEAQQPPPNLAPAQPTPNLAPAQPAQAPVPQPLPGRPLTIYVLEGEGAVHNIHDRFASSPVVEVRDENGLPVEGADVTFQLPAVGPGGSFPGQKFTQTVKTNDQGQATVSFTPNMQVGRFNIRVTANFGSRSGSAVIRQSNSTHEARATTEAKHGLFKFAWWKVAVLAGVGVTVAVILATRGGGSGSSVTLIPGSPTFGAP